MKPAHRPVVAWLFVGCLLIAAMVTVGGVTRLTGSGLSITEWNVLMGSVPPLNESAWLELFAKYQATPQYEQINSGFVLSDFKTIFWWEYTHRLLARLIGIVFLVPYLIFVFTRRVDRPLAVRLFAILALGGMQGVLGWLMVASGLIDNPAVSHLRLAAHLLTAFATFGLTLWIALSLLRGEQGVRSRWSTSRVRVATWGLAALVVLQICWGAFTAGLRAGFLFNTFPTMGGRWIPPGLGTLTPAFRNVVSNPVAVQFLHRVIAWVLLGSVLAYWWHRRRDSRHRAAVSLLVVAVAGQFALGIMTILWLPYYPVLLGGLHQAGGLGVFAAMVMTLHRAEY